MELNNVLNQIIMENGKSNAYPVTTEDNGNPSVTHLGLTKREYFAGLAMQGIVSTLIDCEEVNYKMIAIDSTRIADELLKQLDDNK